MSVTPGRPRRLPARVELGNNGHAHVTVDAWDPHIPATVSLDFLPPEAVTRLRAGDTEVVVEVVTDLGATNADDATAWNNLSRSAAVQALIKLGKTLGS